MEAIQISQISNSALSVILILIGGFIVSFLYYSKRVQTRQARKLEEQEREFSDLLLRSKLDIQQQAFQNCSSGIQNNISQSLVLARMNLNTLAKESPSETLFSAIELLGKTIADLRVINKSLEDEFCYSLTLEEGIRRQLNILKHADDFFADLKIFGEEPFIKPENKIVLLGMILECLKNIMDYAKSGMVKVSCIFKEKMINVIIEDDIVESDTTNNAFIKKIKNCSNIMNTMVTIKTYPNNGTRILIEANT